MRPKTIRYFPFGWNPDGPKFANRLLIVTNIGTQTNTIPLQQARFFPSRAQSTSLYLQKNAAETSLFLFSALESC